MTSAVAAQVAPLSVGGFVNGYDSACSERRAMTLDLWVRYVSPESVC